MKKPISFFLVVNLVFILITVFYSLVTEGAVSGSDNTERIILTTYYPAPYGVYREMRVDRLAVGSLYRYYSGPGFDDTTNGTLIVSDKVGIGTLNPQGSLHVADSLGRSFVIGGSSDNSGYGDNNGYYLGFGAQNNPDGSGYTSQLSSGQTGGGIFSVNGVGDMVFRTFDNPSVINSPKSRKMTIHNNGRVSIGSEAAKEILTLSNNLCPGGIDDCEPINFHIGGQQAIGFNTYYNATNSKWKYHANGAAAFIGLEDGPFSLKIAPSGNAGSDVVFKDAVYVDSAGLVSIGSNLPKAALTIDNNQCNAGVCEPINFNVGDSQAISFNSYWDTTTNTWKRQEQGAAALVDLANNEGDTNSLHLRIATSGNANTDITFADVIVIKTDGKVGIGTNNPQASLDVAGNMTVSGELKAPYKFTPKVTYEYFQRGGQGTTNIPGNWAFCVLAYIRHSGDDLSMCRVTAPGVQGGNYQGTSSGWKLELMENDDTDCGAICFKFE